jgi:rhamnosyltransferase subunit B
MAQCMAAGVPQLIMPMAHDQPDNANRIKKFGIGDYLYPKKFKAARIAEKLESLIKNPAVESACAEIQRRIRMQMPTEQVGEIVEGMAEKALRTRGSARAFAAV